MPIRTFVVDRQEVVRWGLSLACSDAVDIEVVGTAESLASGFELILHATPDVVIVDIQSSDASELEYAQRILAAPSDLKILVFSAVRAICERRIFISHSHPTPSRPKSNSVLKGLRAVSRGDVAESESLSSREREVVLMLADRLTL